MSLCFSFFSRPGQGLALASGFSRFCRAPETGSPSKHRMNKGVLILKSQIKIFGDKVLLRTQFSRRGCKFDRIFTPI
jgi:hypothetical protein